jgi:hypothetical protein
VAAKSEEKENESGRQRRIYLEGGEVTLLELPLHCAKTDQYFHHNYSSADYN